MEKCIALLRGDGIGPEIVDSAVKVLEAVAEKFGHTFTFTRYLIGGAAIDETGNPLPQETIDGCLSSDSVLLGAVGGPKWDNQPAANRPERGLLKLREGMGLYTNVRPAKMGQSTCESAPGKGASRHPRRHGAVHEPAPGEAVSRLEGRMPPAFRHRGTGL